MNQFFTILNNGADQTQSPWGMFIPLIAMFAVFYLVIILPQRRKDKKHKETLSKLVKGDVVITIGGIYGTVNKIKDNVVTLEVGADKVKLNFELSSIKTIEFKKDEPVSE